MIGQKMLTILALAQVALGVSKCKFKPTSLILDQLQSRWLKKELSIAISFLDIQPSKL